MSNYYYTKEQDEWLKANVEIYRTYNELTIAFNKRFNLNKSKVAIEFRMESVHKYKKSQNLGSFKKGVNYDNKAELPLGSEWHDSRQGVTYVKTKMIGFSSKVKDKATGSKVYPYWTLKHRVIYEKANGKIKDDEMVMFLDGNKENFDLSNLACIKKKWWIRIVSNKWYGVNREITRAGIELLRLNEYLKGCV